MARLISCILVARSTSTTATRMIFTDIQPTRPANPVNRFDQLPPHLPAPRGLIRSVPVWYRVGTPREDKRWLTP